MFCKTVFFNNYIPPNYMFPWHDSRPNLPYKWRSRKELQNRTWPAQFPGSYRCPNSARSNDYFSVFTCALRVVVKIVSTRDSCLATLRTSQKIHSNFPPLRVSQIQISCKPLTSCLAINTVILLPTGPHKIFGTGHSFCSLPDNDGPAKVRVINQRWVFLSLVNSPVLKGNVRSRLFQIVLSVPWTSGRTSTTTAATLSCFPRSPRSARPSHVSWA